MQKEHPRQSLLDTAPEAAFDRLTELASRFLRVPVSLISILDDDRQFFKSHCGLPKPLATTRETPLSHSFCKYVAANAAPLIVEDARLHDLLKDNPAVSEFGVVAYLGVPLFDEEGGAYGALCAISGEPRSWTQADVDFLNVLAAQVMSEIVMRRFIGELFEDRELSRQAEQNRAFSSRADRHDLRTPLNALLLSLQALASGGDLDEEQSEFVQMAERNGKALAVMIDQMLDISTLESGSGAALVKQQTSPRDLLDTALEQVTPLAHGKMQSLKSSLETRWSLLVDKDKIVRVLVNLLGNAVKFTAGGGRVSIDVCDCPLNSGPGVSFTIKDSGIGIRPEDLGQIFKEGYRVEKTAPTRRSTGLGLTFCKRIVEAHGGRITVESTFGLGSTFAFVLPAAQ
jgi:signal transduction histidine kinase